MNTPDLAALEHFFETLYGGCDDGWLVLSYPDPFHGEKPGKPRLLNQWHNLRDTTTGDVAQDAARHAEAGTVYHGCVVQHPSCTWDPYHRGKHATAHRVPGFWADIDLIYGHHAASALPTSDDEALDFLHTLPSLPSLIIHSGGGLYPWWLFREPFTITSDAERRAIAQLSQRFHTTLIEAGKEHGWTFDNTSDLARVLRPPGSVNTKYGKIVTLLHEGGERYNPSDFDEWLLPLPEPQKTTHIGAPVGGHLDISAVAEHYGATMTKKSATELCGAHPVHGSSTGTNFDVNPTNGLWHCWRDGTGGDALTLIAVCEGVLGCEKATSGALSGDAFKKVVDIANEKFNGGIPLRAAGAAPRPQANAPTPGAWEPPRSLPPSLSPVPALPGDMLPEPLRPWLVDIAERTQIPLEFVAVPALVALGTVVGRKIGIFPKRHDDWLVIPNLWGAIVGRPGVLKTPALQEALRPLDRLVASAQEQYVKDFGIFGTAESVHEAKVDALEALIKKAAKAQNDAEVHRLAESLNVLKDHAPVPATERRYRTNDSTVEKLGEILRENPEGILLFRDELSGWLYNLDKAGREGDRQFYLEAWNGTGSFTWDRIGRGTVHIPAVCLSIVGGLQPGKLDAYVHDAMGGGIGDDGLLQRFQLVVWPDLPSTWVNVDRYPNTHAKNAAFSIYRDLDALRAADYGATTESPDDIPALRFSAGAQALFDAWRDALEQRLRDGSLESPAFEAHLSKYRSLMPSLALVFHLVDVVAGHQAMARQVSEAAAQLAASWCEFLEEHARRVYGATLHGDVHAAHALAKHITRGEVRDADSVRAIYRRHWAGLQTPEAVGAALAFLERHYWLRVEEQSTGGRPTEIVRINPNFSGNA